VEAFESTPIALYRERNAVIDDPVACRLVSAAEAIAKTYRE
jgi:hypothetical protein